MFEMTDAQIAQFVGNNATLLIVYRLRNHTDLEAFLDEVSGTIGRKEVLNIYYLATKEYYSFPYCNLMNKIQTRHVLYKLRPEVAN